MSDANRKIVRVLSYAALILMLLALAVFVVWTTTRYLRHQFQGTTSLEGGNAV